MSGLPEILYVLGTGRSGSTVLEILLAHAPGTFGAGELTFLVQDALLDDAPCACGRPAKSCPVWGAVLDRLEWDTAKLQDAATVFRRVDAHRDVPRLLTRSADPGLLGAYWGYNRAILAAIAEVTGASRVIDSSKYSARALALATVPELKLRTVRLTRRPAGLMRSWQKPNPGEQPPKSPAAMLAYYTFVGASVRLTERRLGDVHPVAYEALAGDPAGTIEAIGRWLGADLSEVAARLRRGDDFAVGHIVTGNRLRQQRTMRFEPRHAADRPEGAAARAAAALMEIERRLFGL